MNMKNIPEDKKAELLKALQAVVGKIEEIDEEAKATQEAPEEHALSCHPDVLETELRMKVAQIILGGGNHATE